MGDLDKNYIDANSSIASGVQNLEVPSEQRKTIKVKDKTVISSMIT